MRDTPGLFWLYALVAIFCLLLGLTAVFAATDPGQQQVETPTTAVAHHPDRLTRLQAIEPLDPPHWYWPPSDDWYTAKNLPVAIEVARITGTVGVSLRWADDADVVAAATVAARAGAQLTLNWSPWHDVYPRGERNPDPRRRTELIPQTLMDFRQRVANVQQIAGRLGVSIYGVFFDHEKLRTTVAPENRTLRGTVDGDRWDNAVRTRLAIFDLVARDILPDARIVWYGAPHRTHGQGDIAPRCGWGMPVSDALPSLYWPTSPDVNRGRYYRCYGQLTRWWPHRRMPRIMPNVSLGAGYVARGDFRHNLDYPTEVTRQLAVWLKDQALVEEIYFYPAPSTTSGWLEHFIAWCDGWTD